MKGDNPQEHPPTISVAEAMAAHEAAEWDVPLPPAAMLEALALTTQRAMEAWVLEQLMPALKRGLEEVAEAMKTSQQPRRSPLEVAIGAGQLKVIWRNEENGRK